MPLPLTVSCSSKIQIGFTFLVPAYPGFLEKRPLNGCCFQIKYTEAILSNSTWKLLCFQIIETLIVVLKSRFYRVIYYNFWHTSFPVVTGGSCLRQDISYSSLLVPTNRNFAKYVTAADGSVLSTSESSQSSQGNFATI